MDVDIVCGDSYQGAIKLVNHLIERGHRQIAMVSAPMHLSTGRERVEGYKKALKEANIPFDDNLLKIDSSNQGGYSKNRAYELTGELINSESDFTALFVANNFMALGAYKALQENDIKVPEAVSMVCFDDLSLEFEINPFFTVMKQPAHTMGKTAADILIKKIENEYEDNNQQVVFEPQLIVRESSCEKIDS